MINKTVKIFLQPFLKIFFNTLFLIKGEPAMDKNLKQAVDLYKGGDFSELFARIRSWDAPYEELNKAVPKAGKVLDLGCGDGLLANYLAISSPKRNVVGVEISKSRVMQASHGISNAHFKQADILKLGSYKANSVVLAHVLHHLPSKKDQEVLIEKLSKQLKKNSKMVILEISRQPYYKYLFSMFTDSVIVPILFEGKLFSYNFYYRTARDWRKLLTQYGFKVTLKHRNKGMPFSHVVIIATKA